MAALASCRQAGPELPETPLRMREVTVTLGQAGETEETRSIVDIGVEDFQKAALFAFDPQTGLLLTGPDGTVSAFPTRKTFNWPLPVNTDMDIYAIVNYGDLDMASFARTGLHRSELEALRFTSRGPSALKQLETAGQGMPMAGIRRGVRLTAAGASLDIAVKKLYAKYNLYFDLSRVVAEGWHVQAMHMIVENANTEVPYFIEGFRQDDPGKLMEYDRATERDLDELQQGGNGHAVTLYMLENCQGTKSGAESWKTVCKDLGFEALRNCTYIDLSVKIQRAGGEYQNLGYAIYLGKTDMRSDFDIQRNLFKTVRIVLPGPDDPNPASHFFRFSGTDSPTVTPGESLDLYFVTNLDREEIAVSCSPEGRLVPESTTWEAGEDGIATGRIRLKADAGLPEGATCLVTAGSASKGATDQRTVTGSWPTVLDTDLSGAPGYVAQSGVLRVIPTGGIVRVDASVKAGSEGILAVGEAGFQGSLMQFGIAGLAAGTGTVVLRHYNAAGVETGSQEVDLTIQAPVLRFSAERYTLKPDGTEVPGTLRYVRTDGTPFTAAQQEKFDLTLVRRLLFPSSSLTVNGCPAYVEASFARESDADLRQLSVPVRIRVKRLYAPEGELDWTEGGVVGQVSYGGAAAANIRPAEAALSVENPFQDLSGTCLGVVENNLPVYEALLEEPEYLQTRGLSASWALGITSYRNGHTFSQNGAQPVLELTLPRAPGLPVEIAGPEEFGITCQDNKLILTAKDHPARYTGYGRFTLYATVVHAGTGERSSPVEMGYLEIYLIGAIGPYIHGNGPYQLGGTVVPAGDRSPVANLAGQTVSIRENDGQTSLPGYYKGSSGSTWNLYYQDSDIDDHGIDRYACDGETAYLDSYQFRTGDRPLLSDVLEFRFGSISTGHRAGLPEAMDSCNHLLKPVFRQTVLKGKLRHFTGASERDASGCSYCALANLFGGNTGPVGDIYLDISG